MTDQYLRKVSLIVTTGSDGIDLSNFRIVFTTTQMDAEAPNTAAIRIFNLSDATAKQVKDEGQRVVLQAGYQNGNFGVIFEGSIKQFRSGRLNATDKFLDVLAADGDQAYNFACVNKSLKAGSKLQDQVDAILQETGKFDVETGSIPNSLGTGGTLPRGKVLFGMARERLNDVCDSAGTTWSIQNGKIVIIPLTGYAPGDIVVLNARTGMVGIPVATNDGISVKSLLNPKVKIGTRVQIDNKSIVTTNIKEQGFPRYSDLSFPASVSADGVYRVLVAEHTGDTLGNEWYTDLTCLAMDSSAQPGDAVKAYG